MENKIPKTKEECFAQLDAMLSDEDKNELKNSEDVIRFHFSLGMWIRNNWIYPVSDEEIQPLAKEFADYSVFLLEPMFVDADDLSGAIIDSYVDYLKKN